MVCGSGLGIANRPAAIDSLENRTDPDVTGSDLNGRVIPMYS
jgi:hypothetical protein